MGESAESPKLIRLEGPLTVDRGHEIQDLFLSGLDEGGALIVDLSKVERMDLSFVQLFIALRNEAEHRGQSIRLVGTLQEKLRQLFYAAGLCRAVPGDPSEFEAELYELGL